MEHEASPSPGSSLGQPAPAITPVELMRLARRIDRPIVLVGMMGVGKTTVGRRLATMLDLPFVDADEEIERAAQMAIPEIFAQFGEPYFRDGERRVIARLVGDGSSRDRKILATGGGAFVDPDTRQLILDKAISVWLDSDIDTLVERVGRKDNRPLLKQGDPREILSRLREERRPHYAQAAIHVVSGQHPHAVTANKILKAIDSWL
ncbi:shikimate kinase [Novosphingobium olei]|nr:shikimate kinase [Novosphingobium olei]